MVTKFKQVKTENICYCGHDCSKCVTYIATMMNNDTLRNVARDFYIHQFDLLLPLNAFSCHGGRSDDVFRLCSDCPFKKCCRNRQIDFCKQCQDYPCNAIAEYERKYVNKCNQIGDQV